MALPQLNSTPSYRITIPSLGKKTTFRPFLVKEQKSLLIAYETQDRADMVRAITRTIHACVEEPIEESLTTFDVDYLFTQIRAKSVGEVVDLSIKCEECNMSNDISIELDDIVIPERCPLLDIPLFVGSKTCCDNSPTLDKLIPHLGYVPGNVLVISDKANRIKSNASLDDIMLLADNLHKVLVSIPA